MAQIAEILISRRQTLAIAESCTGGLLGHLLTEQPGASKFFQGGIICYQNLAKERLLGVRISTLQKYGSVSSATVAQMAAGALRKLDSDFAVAISGIAGPSGGSAAKPVGTVFFGWASKETTLTFNFLFSGSRTEIKAQATGKALEIILQEISK